MAKAKRLTVMLSSHETVHHRSRAGELLERARALDCAGATVFEAAAGTGLSRARHESHLVREDAPLAFVLVDAPERVAAYLEAVAPLLGDALVVLEDVEAFRA